MLTLYLALALALLVLDARFHYLDLMRQVLAIVTEPLQQLAHAPARGLMHAAGYFQSVDRLYEENQHLQRQRLEGAPQLLRLKQLEVENARLRRLLAMRERQPASGQVAQVLYSARDPFSQRLIVDKGQQDSIVAGLPVVDDAGVIGQVTRVYPFVSEVTLITSKDQALPVQVVRSGMRSLLFGLGDGRLELRFIAANVDVEEGDILVTSGLDGIYLPGFPVARVDKIERDSAYSFASVVCTPLAGVENFGEVMILARREAPPPRPRPEEMVDGAPIETPLKGKRKPRPQ